MLVVLKTYLQAANLERGGRRESGGDRHRDELHQAAHVQQSERDDDDAAHKRRKHRKVGTKQREALHHQRHNGRRSDRHVPAAAHHAIDEAGQQLRVEAVLRRQTGDHRVRDALRNGGQADGQTGHKVLVDVAALIGAREPNDGQPLGQSARRADAGRGATHQTDHVGPLFGVVAGGQSGAGGGGAVLV